MKRPIYQTVFISLFLTSLCVGQELKSGNVDFHIDAGADTVFCETEDISSVYIGEGAIIEGEGTFTIAWEAAYTVGSTTYTASDFLSDTTVLNPTFKNKPLDSDEVMFYLNVTDGSSSVKRDSISIRFSQFTFVPGHVVHYIALGDSVQISYPGAAAGGIEPYQCYLWNPYGDFIDTTLYGATPKSYWCKPTENTEYQGWVVDAAGCVSPKSSNVTVILLASDVRNALGNNVEINGTFIHSTLSQTLTYEYFDLNGRCLTKTISASDYVALPNFRNKVIILQVSGVNFSEVYKLKF